MYIFSCEVNYETFKIKMPFQSKQNSYTKYKSNVKFSVTPRTLLTKQYNGKQNEL